MHKITSVVLCLLFVFSFYCVTVDGAVVKMLQNTDFSNVSNQTYTNKQIKPTIKSSISRNDYIVIYKNNINVGTATVIIKGKNHYIGTIKKKFKIIKKQLKSKDFKLSKKTFTYTGKQIKPKIQSKIKKKYYKVSYLNNIKKGTATVIIKGKGNYKGTVKKKFKIKGDKTKNNTSLDKRFTDIDLDKTYKLKDSFFKIDLSDAIYTGKAIKPTVNTNLPKKYYMIEYENNINVGTATITITGIGNYVGTIKKKFKIIPCKITSKDFRVDTENKFYTSTAIVPNVFSRLIVDDDYTVQYKNNINVGTATITIIGKGNYTGTLEYHFKITQKSLNKGLFDVDIDTVTYNGKAQEKTIKTDLIYNVDYTIRYSNNINVGTATVTIIGKGNYAGEIAYSWHIIPLTINSSWFNVDTSNKTYTGKEIQAYVYTGYVPYNQYDVSYTNNINIGTATVIIKGKGNYTGSVNFSFNIVKPTVNKVASLTLSLKNKVYIVNKWSKVDNATGYEMWRKKAGEDFKKVKTFNSASTTSYTTDKKSSGVTYYVKIRAFVKIGNQMFYGAFSPTAKITTK